MNGGFEYPTGEPSKAEKIFVTIIAILVAVMVCVLICLLLTL